MNKYLLWLVVAVVVVGGAYLLMSGSDQEMPTSLPGGPETPLTPAPEPKPLSAPTGNQGWVVFGVTDEIVSIGNLGSVLLYVKEVMVHSSSQGWISISKDPRIYDLVHLHAWNITEFLAQANLAEGSYQQVRLLIDKILVTPKGGESQVAFLPSSDLKFNINLVVEKGKGSSVVFDFLTEKSLHMTGDGQYVFAPVVHLTSSSEVKTQLSKPNEFIPNGRLDILGGNSKFSAVLGMDEKGGIKIDGGIVSNAVVEIQDGYIKIIPPRGQ